MGMAFKNNTFGTTGAEMGFRSSAIENPDPSANLKFEEVPSGIAAISEVPVHGRLQAVGCALRLLRDRCNVPNPSEPGCYGRGQLGFTAKSIRIRRH